MWRDFQKEQAKLRRKWREKEEKMQKELKAAFLRKNETKQAAEKTEKQKKTAEKRWRKKHGNKVNGPTNPSVEPATAGLAAAPNPFLTSTHPFACAARVGSYLVISLDLKSLGLDIGGGNNTLHFAGRFLDMPLLRAALRGRDYDKAILARNAAGITSVEVAEDALADPEIRAEALRRVEADRKAWNMDKDGPSLSDPGPAVLTMLKQLQEAVEKRKQENEWEILGKERVVDVRALAPEIVLAGVALLLLLFKQPSVAAFLSFASYFVPWESYRPRLGPFVAMFCFCFTGVFAWALGWIATLLGFFSTVVIWVAAISSLVLTCVMFTDRLKL